MNGFSAHLGDQQYAATTAWFYIKGFVNMKTAVRTDRDKWESKKLARPKCALPEQTI